MKAIYAIVYRSVPDDLSALNRGDFKYERMTTVKPDESTLDDEKKVIVVPATHASPSALAEALEGGDVFPYVHDDGGMALLNLTVERRTETQVSCRSKAGTEFRFTTKYGKRVGGNGSLHVATLEEAVEMKSRIKAARSRNHVRTMARNIESVAMSYNKLTDDALIGLAGDLEALCTKYGINLPSGVVAPE